MATQENQNIDGKPRYPLTRPRLPLTTAILHAILLVAGWAAYFLFIKYIISTYNPNDLRFILKFILVCALIIPLVVILWRRHNINIYKDKGPRTHVRTVEEKYEMDWDGRTIIADWEAAKKSNKILIDITDTKKEYLLGRV